MCDDMHQCSAGKTCIVMIDLPPGVDPASAAGSSSLMSLLSNAAFTPGATKVASCLTTSLCPNSTTLRCGALPP